MFDILLTIGLFILVLGVLVLVHECGHFFASKLFKVAVDEFGIGFPPRVYAKKIGSTEYSLNAIPVGGFVRVKGIAGDERFQDNPSIDPDSFSVQPQWKKFVILFAGIAMNVVLAAVLFTVMFWVGVRVPIDDTEKTLASDVALTITYIVPEGPAAKAGMQLGDAVERIGDREVASVTDFREVMQEYSTAPATIYIDRAGEEVIVTVMPEQVSVDGESIFGIGVGMMLSGVREYGVIEGLNAGVRTTGAALVAIVRGFGDLIVGFFTREQNVAAQLSGPVGIAVMTRDFAQQGIAQLFQFAAMLSLNLAVFNLLPLPMLDGGRIFFLLVEIIRRKPVSQQFEMRVHQFGFIALFALLIFVTIKDIVGLL